MRIKTVILRPITEDFDLEIQASWLIPDAYDAMREIADVDINSIKLDNARDDVTVNLGTPSDPYFVTLWQSNLVGAIFIADVEGLAKVQTPVVHIDLDNQHYSRTGVVQTDGSR